MANKGEMLNKKEFKKQEKSLTKSTDGEKWDGRLRLPNDLYKKNWDKVFGKKEEKYDKN